MTDAASVRDRSNQRRTCSRSTADTFDIFATFDIFNHQPGSGVQISELADQKSPADLPGNSANCEICTPDPNLAGRHHLTANVQFSAPFNFFDPFNPNPAIFNTNPDTFDIFAIFDTFNP